MTEGQSQAQEQSVSTVVSSDGVEIGWWTSGEGPPLLLVHGGVGDHTRWDMLRPHLEPRFTVHAVDRRGRGASGDGDAYELGQEYTDLAAVIDAIAEDSGSPVDVYCSSFGGLCAFGAMPLTAGVGRLALYEAWPSVRPEAHAPPPESLERMEALLAQGDREAAIETGYRALLGLSDEELDELRTQPSWPARVAAAHTIPREIRAFQTVRFDPERAALIEVPVLLLIGSESPVWGPEAETVAAALPDTRTEVLEGQGHIADLLAPELVAEKLLGFLVDG